jgi:hypothetical protein
MAELTELQRDILKEKRGNPDDSPKEIAERLDCSESHAYQTLQEYDTAHLDSAEVVETTETNESGSKSSGSSGLIDLLFIKPIQLTVWLMVASFKFSIWLMLLPFRILFGGSND